jgi:hypothetical protein
MLVAPAVLGVDPGVNGGLALLDTDGWPAIVKAFKPGMTEVEVMLEIRAATTVLKRMGGNKCFFEKVGHMTGDGGKGSHTFGSVKGFLRGCILSHDIALCDVYPALWQAKLECLTGGNKAVTRSKAAAVFARFHTMYPKVITNNTADAMLIAQYGRLQLAL